MKQLPSRSNVSWIGKVDWELRKFHGDEYSTHRGSTYNSYLIEEEKVAVIDTVWAPFAKEYVANLEKQIDLQKIDFVIANHAEIDHSGALPELMSRIPGNPIYCTANGVKSLKGHYHQDWNFHPVKTGDRLSLGKKELIFVEAPMLHWPDSMFCYLTGDNILFSNDAFGQHYATESPLQRPGRPGGADGGMHQVLRQHPHPLQRAGDEEDPGGPRLQPPRGDDLHEPRGRSGGRIPSRSSSST